MDTFIFGIGCSGTTMIYSLLQSVYAGLYGENYFSSYEPFIWDMETFNCPYEKTKKLFGRTSSLSIEGQYSHLKTPLFVPANFRGDYSGNEFFRNFTANRGSTSPHLVKFIRGNGRMPIFRQLNPKAKILFVLRNPVDNINCAKYKFSFFGEDFYPSDYPRFCEQLENQSKLRLDKKESGWPQRQAEYCYQMNRAALEFVASDSNSMILEYDQFLRDRTGGLIELCDFLGVPFSNELVKQLQLPTGPTTKLITLSQAEFEAILPYYMLYRDLCENSNIVTGKGVSDIEGKYDGNCVEESIDVESGGYTTNRLRQIIRFQNSQIEQLRKNKV